MADPFEPYLNQAQTLFETGDVVKAGQIWQAILKRDPASEAARAGLYKVKVYFDSRATQDGLVKAAPEASPEVPNRQTLTPPSPEVNSLLDAGCALYDAGLVAKAIATWEMALHQDPENPLAKGYIDGARRKLEGDNAPEPVLVAEPPPPPPPPPEEDDQLDKLLRDGCTLFDMGQPEDALLKWERILAINPGHALAIAYANDARKDLGLAPLVPGEGLPASAAPPPAPEAHEAHSDVDLSRAGQLVREGVQIYDMGMVDEAIVKWEQALELEPSHRDAGGYLEMARRDREQLSPARVAPAPPPPPPQDPLEPRILAAENLLRNQKFEEASFAFQLLLEGGSRDSRVLQGYQHARAFLSAQEAPPPEEPPAPAPPEPVEPVGPPRTLTTKAPVRSGLKLPLGSLNLPVWFESPKNLAILGGGILLAVLALGLFRSHQRDVALKDAILSAKANAMAPIARRSQVVSLAETPQEIRQEAEHALGDDPLTAYYRVQECLRLDPGDAASAQLLERARAKMAETPPVGSELDLDKSMKSGDLEAARNAVFDQLRRNPDDSELKAKGRTILLALVQSYATNEHFTEAREALVQGRAMFPQDKTWPARLKLLEEIQAMGKPARANWIPLLG